MTDKTRDNYTKHVTTTQYSVPGARVSSTRNDPLHVSRDDKTTSLHHYGGYLVRPTSTPICHYLSDLLLVN